MEYAIVDIETTGGNARGSRMTEIAICIHNGEEVLERYETLINPEKEIPLPIFALTGINNELVKHAPVFADIAEQVFEMLDGRVFIAHNVNFDYSFVRHQLDECGFKWSPKKLCTVRLARKIKPGLRSYSLGNLCGSLNIPIKNRHRAGGDCDATAILFTMLLESDKEGVIPEMLKKASKDQRLPPNLPKEQFDHLPEKCGVYYFHDLNGKVIYVGKAVNIKKRIGQHFTGHNINPQRQHFLREIHSISFEVCATELMALILECTEIKRLWPTYNRALKRFEPKFGLVVYEDMMGYKRLAVGRLAKHTTCVQACNREYEAVTLLRGLAQEFAIDLRYCNFGKLYRPESEEPNILDLEEHNAKVKAALESLEVSRKTYALMDKGRESGEKSCIWVQKGHLYAMGYLASDNPVNNGDEIRDSLKRYYGNHYIMQLIESYAEKHPHKVLKIQEDNCQNEIVYNDLMYEDGF
jgi:DNA polymerase-3 subunit epsilon